mgnify:FL=1
MISVTFYKFYKRSNSTKRPSGGGVSLNVVLKSPSDIMNPVLELSTSENPSKWNYAYIPHFGRYYYIAGITWSYGLWVFNLKLDVMATARDEIASANLYVLRASNDFDTHIADSMYHAKVAQNLDVNITSPFGEPRFGDGYYVMGVLSGTSTTDYYALKATDYANFVSNLFNIQKVTGSWVLEDSDIAQVQANLNMGNFITGVKWFPAICVIASMGNPYSTMKVGWWDFDGFTAWAIVDNYNVSYPIDFYINVPKHPQSASRGQWLNGSTHSAYILHAGCFGDIPLDNSVLYHVDSIRVRISADLVSGVGVMRLSAGDVDFNTVFCQIGVDVALNGISNPSFGKITSPVIGLIGGVAATASSALTGNVMGVIAGASSVADTILGAESANNPTVYNAGSNGDMCSIAVPWSLQCQFKELVEENNADKGRPLCKIRNVGGLGGYIQVLEGDVETDLSDSENSQIQAILQGGFYFE